MEYVHIWSYEREVMVLVMIFVKDDVGPWDDHDMFFFFVISFKKKKNKNNTKINLEDEY